MKKIPAGLSVNLAVTSLLPMGNAPAPAPFPHFPDRLHTYVWRNWQLVPAERMASVVSATPDDIVRMGRSMGLTGPPRITPQQSRRSALTIIRRNWHLLPYSQLLQLLGWSEQEMAFSLREDDFLFIKLGSAKPQCAPIVYRAPDEKVRQREQQIAAIMRREFPGGVGLLQEPLFDFVRQLSQPLAAAKRKVATKGNSESEPSNVAPRFCYSYFALYGDPLLDSDLEPYPNGYLERLRASGVNGVWLPAVLYKLAPFPWDTALSEHHEKRLQNLKALVARARRHGIGIYLYLNEPRAMPLAFYETRPQLKGAVEGDHAALCTTDTSVQKYIADSVATICRAVPELAGFFTITASENLTNCWSHATNAKTNCPRCSSRSGAEVITEVNTLVRRGIAQAGSKTRLLAWDWGWPDAWAEPIINQLPADVALMSVSEWDLPIRRGGTESSIGEYSLSAIGPGPRAKRHWEIARRRGLQTVAKIQASNTWELSAVPYIPAVESAARHAANLKTVGVDGLMLGWTLGGYPSPNLEAVAEIGQGAVGESPSQSSPQRALQIVAERRFGRVAAPRVMEAWHGFSAAFSEFPFHIGLVYQGPQQLGPANLLWEKPTGFSATMVGFPYDDLDGWRAVYPREVFASQFQKMADGFAPGIAALQQALNAAPRNYRTALQQESSVAQATALHFASVAHQARFIIARDKLAQAKSAAEAKPLLSEIERLLKQEIALARGLYALQSRDSRLGFEASNQYYYVPCDLAEKVLNCHDLLHRWLPQERAKWRP